MKCRKCQFENSDDMQFCGRCGIRIYPNICPKCKFANPPEFQFCGKCGERLTQGTLETPSPVERKAPEAEYRHLTVMFCDLVDSTSLSEKLDPEELRNVFRDYQEVCAKVIKRFEGYIARYFGDGLLVYFGYPLAHEDDAQRAVRSGLGIVEAIERLNRNLQENNDINLEVRLGIHTGMVVAGDMGGTDDQLESRAIIGETPNIAARLQGIAEPNTLVISDVTHRLIQGYFDCKELGSHILRGISRSISVYQVLHESGARSRLDVIKATGLIPLIGREQELGLLLERWRLAGEKTGGVILLAGEAGIGKSRLLQELKERVAEHPQAWLIELHCSPYHQNSALYPVTDLFERVILRFESEETAQEKLNKLEGFLVQYGFSLPEVVPLYASLLSIPISEDRYPLLNLTPQRQKQKLFQSLVRTLLERAHQQPVLFIMEDLQWADPSSLELLSLVIDQVSTTSILAIFSFRTTFQPPWTPRSYITYLNLSRLSHKQGSLMVQWMTKGKMLPNEVLQQILDKSDGVPLFVEELTKMVLESGLLKEQEDHYEMVMPLPPLAIPETLHDSLIARLDRLSTVKEVIQLGAILGREFTYEMLHAVSTLDEAMLQRDLARLVEAELLYQRGLVPQATYLFKHALIQEEAYQSLLRSTRQQYHQRIAQVIEERFPQIAETQPELLAHHYTESGLKQKAITYWQKTGDQAVKRSANVEAVNHFKKGLELLESLPDNTERIQQELALQFGLGNSLIAIRGHAAPEVEKIYTRAWELCQQLGESPKLFPLMCGLFMFYLARAEYQTAYKLGEQLLTIAYHQQDEGSMMHAHNTLGIPLVYLGDLVSAQEHLAKVIEIYDPQKHRLHIFTYRQDAGVVGRIFSAWALALLGYLDQAAERIQDALNLAQEVAHPFSQAYAHHFAAIIHRIRRESQIVLKHAEAEIVLSREKGFSLFIAGGTIHRGWALAEQGQIDEGIVQIRQGIAGWKATGARISVTNWFLMLAEAYKKAGKAEEGLAVMNKALEEMHKIKEHLFEAELYRMKGEFLLISGETETEAEALFLQAIEVAERQKTKLLELRSIMSLSRLWRKQDREKDARELLAEVYNWFTEGFETADLREAKILIEELL